MELVTANTGRVRRERWRGRDWFVAPVSMIVPGVLPGSRGALYYPPDETAAVVNDWDGMPITVYHPRGPGGHVTANNPGVLERQGVGLVRFPSFRNKLAGEAWVDAEKVRNVDRRVYEALNAGKPMEVSTGLFTDNEPAANDAHHNGRRYVAVARNHRPDHLAILPDERGACSLQDGCGLNVNRCHCGGTCEDCKGLGAVKEQDTDDEPETKNAFCPTGEGGGMDNSCDEQGNRGDSPASPPSAARKKKLAALGQGVSTAGLPSMVGKAVGKVTTKVRSFLGGHKQTATDQVSTPRPVMAPRPDVGDSPAGQERPLRPELTPSQQHARDEEDRVERERAADKLWEQRRRKIDEALKRFKERSNNSFCLIGNAKGDDEDDDGFDSDAQRRAFFAKLGDGEIKAGKTPGAKGSGGRKSEVAAAAKAGKERGASGGRSLVDRGIDWALRWGLLEETRNAFCPTGKGGGVDPSCGSSGSAGKGDIEEVTQRQARERTELRRKPMSQKQRRAAEARLEARHRKEFEAAGGTRALRKAGFEPAGSRKGSARARGRKVRNQLSGTVPTLNYVREEGGKFCVYSESGKKLGEYPTRTAAEKRLKQIEYFKHTKNKGTNMAFKRQPIIDFLTANCSCWKGKAAVLNGMSDDDLRRFAEAYNVAKRNELIVANMNDGIDLGDCTLIFNERAEPVLVNADGEEMPMKKKKGPQHGESEEEGGGEDEFGDEMVDDSEEDDNPSSGTSYGQTTGPNSDRKVYTGNRRRAAATRRTAGTFHSVNSEEQMTENQWLANAPAAIREQVEYGQRALRNDKLSIVRKLVANVADPKRRHALGERLMRESIGQLEERLELLGPTANDSRPGVRPPIYVSGGYNEQVDNASAEEDEADVSEMTPPVANYHDDIIANKLRRA